VGIWEFGRKLAFAGIGFGRLFRVVSWDLEYGIEDYLGGGKGIKAGRSGSENSIPHHINTYIYRYESTTTKYTMPPKIPHLLVPSAGSRASLSDTKSASHTENQQSRTPTKNKPFLLGGETPPSRMSLPTSKVPTRRGSFMSREGSDPTQGPTEGSPQNTDTNLRRSRRYDDGLNSLGPVFEALKAHAEEQGEGSGEGGEKTLRLSRGDRTTVRS
jgi:hypothetical protein